jgi:16S rRNA (uracil1498-N3)-methyltransferase
MHIFYTPDITGDTYTLSAEESKHCIRVLRLSENDTITLIDGRGGLYTAIIAEAHAKQCLVKVLEKKNDYGKRNYHLHIALAPTKMNERTEWFLEKVTEIGFDSFTPIVCEHSERKEVKIDRLMKVVTAAVKQSIKAYYPQLNNNIRFKDFISQKFDGQKFIAHCNDGEKSQLQQAYKPGSDALILIGPEGDFSPNEVALAAKQGYVPISLGTSRLRTETAGVVACHTISLLNNN